MRFRFKYLYYSLTVFAFVYFANFQSNRILLETQIKEIESSAEFDVTFNGGYTPNPSKFLIYTCIRPCRTVSCFIRPYKPWCGGYADRLKGIATAFLWAILTNRTFLIRSTNPCALKEHLEPNLIRWDTNVDRIIDSIERKTVSVSKFDLYGPKTILDLNLLEYDKDVEVILVKSNFDISQIIANQTKYHERLRELGMRPNDVRLARSFYWTYNMLFKLKSHLKIQYDDFLLKAKPNKRTKLICAQIRMGGETKTFKDQVRMVDSQVKEIWQFIKKNFSQTISESDYKIYLTSDNDGIYDEAKKEFDKDKVIITSGEVTHIDRDVRNNRIKNVKECLRFDKTYLDFHLLSACDMGVISRSGFGRLGVYNKLSFENIYTYRSVKGKYKFIKTG